MLQMLVAGASPELLLQRLDEALARTSQQVNTIEQRFVPRLRQGIAAIGPSSRRASAKSAGGSAGCWSGARAEQAVVTRQARLDTAGSLRLSRKARRTST